MQICLNSFYHPSFYSSKVKRSEIITEHRNENTRDIDLLPTIDMLRKLNEEDKKVAYAIEKELPNIANAVDTIADQFRKGGRLFYFGAGDETRVLFARV